MPPSISQAVESFLSEVRFSPNTKTKSTYTTALTTWCKYLSFSGIEPLTSPLSLLQPDSVSKFLLWMSTPRKPSKTRSLQKVKQVLRYSPASLYVYQQGLLRALNYWRSKGWIAFSKEDEKSQRKAREIVSRKSQAHYSRRALQVPSDFGFLMIDAVNSIPLPDIPLERLEVLRSRALIYILFSTGLRISDACALTRQHLTTALENNGEVVVETKKTGNLTYSSFIPDAIRAIKAYLRARNDKFPSLLISHGRGHHNDSRLPSSRPNYGEPLSYTPAFLTIKLVGHKAYGSNAKLTFLGPHAFRHWYAQFLISQGVRLENVQSRLGHKSPVTTKEIYAPKPNAASLLSAARVLQVRLSEISDTKKGK